MSMCACFYLTVTLRENMKTVFSLSRCLISRISICHLSTSAPAEIGGTFKYDGSSQGFTFFPTNKVVRPSPRRAPSTHVVAPSDVGIWGGPDLIDDKNRRVKIRGSFDDLPTMKKLKTCELSTS